MALLAELRAACGSARSLALVGDQSLPMFCAHHQPTERNADAMKALLPAFCLLLVSCGEINSNPVSPSPTPVPTPRLAPTPASAPAPTPVPVGETPETFTGSIGGGSPYFPTCGASTRTSTLYEEEPCSAVSVVSSTSGILTATLTWGGGNSDLDLYLFRGDDQLAASAGVGPEEEISAQVGEGMTYRLVVGYYRGDTVEDFVLRVSVSPTRTVTPAAGPLPDRPTSAPPSRPLS